MPYIGKGANGFGIRETFQYTATSNQTAFTGSDINSKTLSFDNGSLVDVLLNGITLKPTTDYNTSTTNTITLTSGASASDEVMIIVYDVFSLSDAMPKTGGTFTGAVTHTGSFTSVGIDDNADATAITINNSENVGIGTTSPTSPLGANFKVLDINSGVWGGNVNFSGNSGGYIGNRHSGNGGLGYYSASGQGHDFHVNGTTTSVLNIESDGDVNVKTGNLVIGTNGKGIDFTSNSNASGMTSELLDDYEEGQATVNMVSSGATFAFGGSDGSETTLYYIKIGRLVHYFMNWDSSAGVTGTTTNAVSITNLPFSSTYGDTFAVWFHRGGPGAVDIMPTAYSTSMSFMVSPTGGGMWSDLSANYLNHSDQRLRISGTTIVD